MAPASPVDPHPPALAPAALAVHGAGDPLHGATGEKPVRPDSDLATAAFFIARHTTDPNPDLRRAAFAVRTLLGYCVLGAVCLAIGYALGAADAPCPPPPVTLAAPE